MLFKPEQIFALLFVGAYLLTFIYITIRIIQLKFSENAENKDYVRKLKTLYRMIFYVVIIPIITMNVHANRYIGDIRVKPYTDAIGAITVITLFAYLLIQGASNYRNRTKLSTTFRVFVLLTSMLSFMALGVQGSD